MDIRTIFSRDNVNRILYSYLNWYRGSNQLLLMNKELIYKRIGAGNRTIVLVHYFGGNADSWRWVLKRLKDEFSLVVITLPGFGNTSSFATPSIFDYATYINACITELKLVNYILCGHSMGGKLILYANQIATEYKADGLVLIAPSPPTTENMEDSEKRRMLPRPTIEAAKRTVVDSTVRKLKDKRLAIAINSQLQVDEKSWRWWLEEGMENDISNRIEGADTPTFVICAKDDPIISMDSIYKEVLPNLQRPKLIQLGRCGHLIPLEAPRKLARRLRKIANNILTP